MDLFNRLSVFIFLFAFILETKSLRNQQDTIDNLCYINNRILGNDVIQNTKQKIAPTKLSAGLKKYQQTTREKLTSYWSRIDPKINENLPSLKPLKAVQIPKSSFTNTRILPRLSSIEQKLKIETKGKIKSWNIENICYKDLLQLLNDSRELLYFLYQEISNQPELETYPYIWPLEKLSRLEYDIESLRLLLKTNIPPISENVKSYISSIRESKEAFPIVSLAYLYYFCKEWAISGTDTLNHILKLLKIPKTLRSTKWDQDVMNLEMSIDKLALGWDTKQKSSFLEELEYVAKNSIKLVEVFKINNNV